MADLYVIFGFAAGAVMAWFILRSYLGGRYRERIAELERGRGAAEAVEAELREQLSRKDAETAGLREELSAEKREKVEATTRLEAACRGFDEQKRLMEAMKQEMTDTFNALSSAALKSSSEDFLRLATERLGAVVNETKGRLGEHKSALDAMIKPLNEMLKRYEEQVKGMEERRHRDHGSLVEQLRALSSTHENLKKETGNLVAALRKPHVRGRWGEMQLRRVAEVSGMSAHCDFTEQLSVVTEDGRLRPDMVVHLPNGRSIVVDSKVPLEAFLDAATAKSDEERRTHMERHVKHVRNHMNKLAGKEYWSQFETSPDLVVLFMPGESFFSAALEADASIMEDAMQKKVMVATPTTFIALLHAIAYGWRQDSITKNAQQVSELGKELYERMYTLVKHFNTLGASINRVNEDYNRVIGSMERRVFSSVRKFRELGATGGEEMPATAEVEVTSTRVLNLDSKTRP